MSVDHETTITVSGADARLAQLCEAVRRAAPHATIESDPQPGTVRLFALESVSGARRAAPLLGELAAAWAEQFRDLAFFVSTLVECAQLRETLFVAGKCVAARRMSFDLFAPRAETEYAPLTANEVYGDGAAIAAAAQRVAALEAAHPWPPVETG